MDAIFYGIATLFEWIFAVAKPLGRIANILFIAIGFIGTFYWLWYDRQSGKGGNNFMSEGPGKN
jgi:hypothetical protein